jgi:Zn-dependent M32 family carboxypeptidase
LGWGRRSGYAWSKKIRRIKEKWIKKERFGREFKRMEIEKRIKNKIIWEEYKGEYDSFKEVWNKIIGVCRKKWWIGNRIFWEFSERK